MVLLVYPVGEYVAASFITNESRAQKGFGSRCFYRKSPSLQGPGSSRFDAPPVQKAEGSSRRRIGSKPKIRVLAMP